MASWHALLAPLPPDAVPAEQPLAPASVLATPEGAAIAGWRQLVVHMSAGCDGLRVVLVMLDEAGVLLSASDGVVYRREDGPHRVHFRHETFGGRFEPDGRFAGRHWTSLSVEIDGEVAEAEASPPVGREPNVMETAALRDLAADVVRRAASGPAQPASDV
jgi:hypothetical protein